MEKSKKLLNVILKENLTKKGNADAQQILMQSAKGRHLKDNE